MLFIQISIRFVHTHPKPLSKGITVKSLQVPNKVNQQRDIYFHHKDRFIQEGCKKIINDHFTVE